MIIVVAGIKRSGSTVQYNLIRIALEMSGYKITPFGHSYQTDREPAPNEVHLIKRHPYDRDLALKADQIFLTTRAEAEIVRSLQRFNGKAPKWERIADMKKHLNKWKQHTNWLHYFPYSLWQSRPQTYTRRVIDALGVNVDGYKVLKAFNSITPPKEGQDPVTLMFHNHITEK